ncbi:diguanylate cyclase [Pseudomonas sp. AFG_SD02_1510_Pfu_092]|nr:diguanylate cyclase [Pseudomonas sp. AFG_SD02_1510_Pfu_092]
MGAALAANTGVAGAMHRAGCFAGLPAPTGDRVCPGLKRYDLWERL